MAKLFSRPGSTAPCGA